jgi:hypothetical protein
MFIQQATTASISEFKNVLLAVQAEKGVKGLLILACDANAWQPEDIDPLLKNLKLPVCGGVFPEIIHGKEKMSLGFIVAGLYQEPEVVMVPSLSDPNADYEALVDACVPCVDEAKSMLVFVDGLSSRIAALVDSLFNVFGLELNYLGGGAGSLSFVQRPCLFTRQGMVEDAGQLVMMKRALGVGVAHGWKSIQGPFKVTSVDRNVVKELDWRPAFDVYREVVESHSGQTFTDANFFDIAKGYPFGINKLDSEKIVRDPLQKQDDGSMICVGEVPSECYVDILTGERDSLIEAACLARQRSLDALPAGLVPRTALFIDCISRVLFLENEFDQELNAVQEAGMPLIGALTLGEIANNGRDYLEFYNKTAVFGHLEG